MSLSKTSFLTLPQRHTSPYSGFYFSQGKELPQSAAAENELVARAEREWNDACLQGEFARLKAIMAAGYMDINDDGTFDTRSANLRSTKSGAQKFTALLASDVLTRVYGDVAINTGLSHLAHYDLDPQGSSGNRSTAASHSCEIWAFLKKKPSPHVSSTSVWELAFFWPNSRH